MEKIKCCKICNRIDFKEDGAYLVCRICGEKRRKHPFPIPEFVMTLLSSVFSIYSTALAFQVGIFRDAALSGAKPWEALSDNTFLSVFMQITEKHLSWVGPLLWGLAAVLILLTVFLARRLVSKLSLRKVSHNPRQNYP